MEFKESTILKTKKEELQTLLDDSQKELTEARQRIDYFSEKIQQLKARLSSNITIDEELEVLEEIYKLQNQKEIANERISNINKKYEPELKIKRDEFIHQTVIESKEHRRKAFEKLVPNIRETQERLRGQLKEVHTINQQTKDFITQYEEMLGQFFEEMVGGLTRDNNYIYTYAIPDIKGISESEQINLIKRGVAK